MKHLINNRHQCFYCGTKLHKLNRSKDHVRPRSRGHGLRNNRVYSCLACNGVKGDLSVSEFMDTTYFKFYCKDHCKDYINKLTIL